MIKERGVGVEENWKKEKAKSDTTEKEEAEGEGRREGAASPICSLAGFPDRSVTESRRTSDN